MDKVDANPAATEAQEQHEAALEAEKTANNGTLKLLRWRPDEPDKKDGTTRAAGKKEVS